MLYHQSPNSRGNYHYNIWTYTTQTFDHHFHKNPELVYVMQGSLNCTINNQEYLLQAGEFGLCLSYDIHSYTPSEHTAYWVLVFSEDFVHSFAEMTRGKTGESFAFRCSEPVMNYLQSQLLLREPTSVFSLKSCLYAVCDEYLRQIRLSDHASVQKQLILSVTDYLRDHYQTRVTLSDLAKLLGYDYHYLSRYFNTMFRSSFSDFLNAYRLEHAIRLLLETDTSITEIALESGFQSVRNFHYYFRKNLGMSPGEYKHKQQPL